MLSREATITLTSNRFTEGPGPRRGTARVLDRDPARPPGVVLGGHVTGLGTTRCLGRAGLPVVVVVPPGDYAARSRWSQRVESGLAETDDGDELAEYLGTLGLVDAVVFPCSDAWARAAAGMPDAARARFRVSVPALETLDVFLDKGRLAAHLDRLGVPHPRTFAVDDGALPESIDDMELGSFFVKPRDSQAFVRLFGVKGFMLVGAADAAARLEAAHAAGQSVLLQEYVPGPPDTHYFVDGYAGADSRPLALFARRRLRMHPPDFGNSTFHVSVPLDEVDDAVDHIRRVLIGSDYHGIFSAEFKRDARDGELKLLEVNVRPWWYVEFAALCGVDVCDLAYRDALGLPLEEVTTYETGRACVLPGADVRAFLSARSAGGFGLAAWLRSWAGADHTVWRLDDPLPAVFQLSNVLRRSLRGRAPRRGR